MSIKKNHILHLNISIIFYIFIYIFLSHENI